ncbi:MAG: TetR/AcrR family transcriptional regulator [Sarcina sp.]
MPKIINNIERTILEESTKIFSEKGYTGSEMKAIAKASGIAVGTLYNYYPNKKMIYRDVFLKSWNKTIKKLEDIKIGESNPKELKKQIEILYTETEQRNGLGIDFRGLCKQGDKEFDGVAREVLEEFIKVTLKRFNLKKEFKASDELYLRIVIIWITSQFELISDFPNKKKENLQILYMIVSNFFEFEQLS